MWLMFSPYSARRRCILLPNASLLMWKNIGEKTHLERSGKGGHPSAGNPGYSSVPWCGLRQTRIPAVKTYQNCLCGCAEVATKRPSPGNWSNGISTGITLCSLPGHSWASSINRSTAGDVHVRGRACPSRLPDGLSIRCIWYHLSLMAHLHAEGPMQAPAQQPNENFLWTGSASAHKPKPKNGQSKPETNSGHAAFCSCEVCPFVCRS